jgi:hypothetical protein
MSVWATNSKNKHAPGKWECIIVDKYRMKDFLDVQRVGVRIIALKNIVGDETF